jgi:hypothetical protein
MEKEVKFQEGDTVEVKGSPSGTSLEPAVPETLTAEPTKKSKKDPDGFKSMFKNVGKISVKPYIDPNMENMGLEDYGMAIFPECHHEEQLAAIERHGVVRYITGLDEFAPEVQNIKDAEQKAAVIYNIRSVVAYLEKTLATNVITDLDDPEFWNKVNLLRPDNHEFWSRVSLRAGNEPIYLNPTDDPYDLIKMMSIEAGGFDLVAKSFEDAMAQAVPPKFYLDKEVQTVSSKTTYKKLRNKAIGLLDGMADKNSKKLLYVAKILDSNSASYKFHTPSDILYDSLDEFINGGGIETNKSRAAEMFIDTASLDMETLKLKALTKDATFYKTISLKADGHIYHTASSTLLGRNVSDVVLYLKNPLNEDMLMKILNEVEGYWKN